MLPEKKIENNSDGLGVLNIIGQMEWESPEAKQTFGLKTGSYRPGASVVEHG